MKPPVPVELRAESLGEEISPASMDSPEPPVNSNKSSGPPPELREKPEKTEKRNLRESLDSAPPPAKKIRESTTDVSKQKKSRREELLKQLRNVEDAIAKKRK